jgi:hypothetical protein
MILKNQFEEKNQFFFSYVTNILAYFYFLNDFKAAET